MMMTYLAFVQNRHRIWVQRQAGAPAPWTDDPILAARKFTNVFRVLDPGSQYVLTDLDEPGVDPVDLALRVVLYRHTGRVEVWQHVAELVGQPTVENLGLVHAEFKRYRGQPKVITRYPWVVGKAGGAEPKQGLVFPRRIFTGAYIVNPGGTAGSEDKLETVIALVRRLLENGTLAAMASAPELRERFAALRANSGLADFMALQIATDWGYTRQATADQENDFVVCGPGARRGAAAVAPGWDPLRTLTRCHKALLDLDEPPVIVTTHGTERTPSYMDVQNTLCEFSKYVRFMGQAAKAKPYTPAHPGAQPAPVLPQHWI